MTLKDLRNNTRMKHETLALLIGTGRSTIACWETGRRKPTRENMQELARIFKQSYADIEQIFYPELYQ